MLESTDIRTLPSITLDAQQLRALGVKRIPRAGSTVLLNALARVVHASTSDTNRDGKLDAAQVTLELDLDETELEEVPEEPRRISRDEVAERLYGRK